MKKKYVLILCVILCAVCFVTGFFTGRKTVSYETEIRYVQGEAVQDTVYFPVPVREVVYDTIFLVEDDTAKTVIDWNMERLYTMPLLNDNRGILDLSATIQFNRLQDVSFEFIPVYKEVTRYRVPVWQPYAGASYNTFNQFAVTGGFFHKKIGYELQYVYDHERKKKAWGIGFKYKF